MKYCTVTNNQEFCCADSFKLFLSRVSMVKQSKLSEVEQAEKACLSEAGVV